SVAASGVVRPLNAVMSALAPLAAAPRLARAPAAVVAAVPPLTKGNAPETSAPRATNPGPQSVPLKRKCCPATGAVAKTFTPRIRATVVVAAGPVTSPPSVTAFVDVAVTFVRPAPLPIKAPTNRLLALDIELTPLKVLEPANV